MLSKPLALVLVGMVGAWLLESLRGRASGVTGSLPDLTPALEVLGMAAAGFGVGRLWGPQLWATFQGFIEGVFQGVPI